MLILPNLNYISGELKPNVSLLKENELLVYHAIKNDPTVSGAILTQTLPISSRTIDRIIKNLDLSYKSAQRKPDIGKSYKIAFYRSIATLLSAFSMN